MTRIPRGLKERKSLIERELEKSWGAPTTLQAELNRIGMPKYQECRTCGTSGKMVFLSSDGFCTVDCRRKFLARKHLGAASPPSQSEIKGAFKDYKKRGKGVILP